MTPLFNLVETLPTTLPFGIDLLLRATIILGIAHLMSRALKRRSAATRHFVVTLGLAAVIATLQDLDFMMKKGFLYKD